MSDALGVVVVLALAVLAVVYKVRRRWRLSADARELEALRRETRSLKREQRRERWS